MNNIEDEKNYGKAEMIGGKENARGNAGLTGGKGTFGGKAAMIDDEDLSDVTGGATFGTDVIRVACSHCGRYFPIKISHSRVKCPYCQEINTFEG